MNEYLLEEQLEERVDRHPYHLASERPEEIFPIYYDAGTLTESGRRAYVSGDSGLICSPDDKGRMERLPYGGGILIGVGALLRSIRLRRKWSRETMERISYALHAQILADICAEYEAGATIPDRRLVSQWAMVGLIPEVRDYDQETGRCVTIVNNASLPEMRIFPEPPLPPSLRGGQPKDKQ